MKEQALKPLKESALECSFCTGLICDAQENLEAGREWRAPDQPRARTDVCLGGSVREGQGGSLPPLAAPHPGLALRAPSVPTPVLLLCGSWSWMCSLAPGRELLPCQCPRAICIQPAHGYLHMYLLTLLIFVLSLNSGVYWVVSNLNLRPEGLIRSPCLICISRGQRVSLHTCMAEQGKERPLTWAAAGYI